MPIQKLIILVQAAIFGLLIGSFLNVCVYRIPKKLSILGRSFCPQCRTPIPLYRNIPIISYLLQGCKSACCKQPIPIQYPLVEALTGFMSVITILHSTSLEQYFLWFLLFICPLITISIIDFQLKIIPDVISLPFIVVGVLVRQFEFWPDWSFALSTSAMGIFLGGGSLLLLAVVISKIKGQDAMGGGDIKLTAMLGAFLGLKALIFVFFASSVLALVYFISLLIFKKLDEDRTIPFGPFLSMGGMLFWLYGRDITDWYFHRAGMPNFFF